MSHQNDNFFHIYQFLEKISWEIDATIAASAFGEEADNPITQYLEQLNRLDDISGIAPGSQEWKDLETEIFFFFRDRTLDILHKEIQQWNVFEKLLPGLSNRKLFNCRSSCNIGF